MHPYASGEKGLLLSISYLASLSKPTFCVKHAPHFPIRKGRLPPEKSNIGYFIAILCYVKPFLY